MVQAIGAVLILFGALAWHIASSGTEIHNITDLWDDFMLTMQGKPLS